MRADPAALRPTFDQRRRSTAGDLRFDSRDEAPTLLWRKVFELVEKAAEILGLHGGFDRPPTAASSFLTNN